MSLAASLPARWQARVPRRVTRRARRVGKKRFSSFGGTRRPPLSRASSSSPGEADASGEADAPAPAPAPSRFFAGVGVGDCTGPMDGVGMMGYARLSQISTGLRQRQKARAFVVAETRPTFLKRSQSKRDEFVDEDDFDDDHHHHHVQKRTKKRGLVALVVVDACMVFPDLKPAVLRRVAEKVAESSFLAEMYSELDLEGVFDEANVCVCATHTHSAPGGYAPHGLYNLTFGGAVSESFDALLNGAADALFAAFVDAFETSHEREPEKRTVAFARGALVGASANRSRSAHARNPETDTAPFARAGGVDETIAALVVGAYDEPERAFVPRGVAAWYAVHGTSLPGSNTLISGDNKGIASSLTESALRSALSGDDSAVTALVSLFETLRLTETNADRGLADAGAVAAAAAAAARVTTSGFEQSAKDRTVPVVAAFPQSASGDVSPNVLGAFDAFSKTRCDGSEASFGVLGLLGKKPRVADCVGVGPNGTEDDKFLGCLVTGTAQAAACVSLLRGASYAPVSGPVRAAARWVPIGREGGVAIAKASAAFTATPALGYSFAAGTTDGPGENGFRQGDREEERWEENGKGKRKTKQRFLGRVATFVFGGARGDFGVSEETRAAHRPKPVLVSFDEPRRARTESGGNLGWVQRDVQVQVFRLGNVLIVSVPAEVTTVAGRRLARAAERAARDAEDQKNTTDRRGSWSVVVNGLANGYSGYVTTEHEYEEQRYEGASGLYGPNALRLYERVVAELVGELVDDGAEKKKKSSSLVERTLAGAEADPRAYDEFRRNRETRTRDGPQSFVPPFDARWPPWARFGDVLRGPARFGTKDGKKTGKKILRVGARGDDGEARATFLPAARVGARRPPPSGRF
jgi:neutral ceramidase